MSGEGFASLEQAETLLGSLLTGIDGVIDGKFWRVGGDQLLDLGRQLEMLGRKVFAAQVRLAGEIDAQGLASSRSCSSTWSLLRQALNISAGDAALRVRVAQAVLPQDLPSGGETPPLYPHLGAAIDAGRVGVEHVRTTLATLDRLPRPVRAQAEAALVNQAVTLDPNTYDRIALYLENNVNPDGTLADDTADARMDFKIGRRNPSTGLTAVSGHLDDVSAAAVRTAIDALSAPAPAVNGVPDPRTAGCRAAQALAHLSEWFLTHGDAPDSGGERPHLTVTLDYDTLLGQIGTATLGNGDILSAAQARRLLCDAQIVPAVLGGASEVLDVGRSMRTASVAIRRALALRDQGCAWPGCDRPPSWCDAHHIDWWGRDFGTTNATRMTLLCPYHHSAIHKSQWTIVMNHGHPEFKPPPWIHPTQRPLRNTLHDIPDPSRAGMNG